ncbi:MAG: hypothetical protein FJW27_00405 [Acidimicrobiia bacterium]|nr:hypothetical protein [Acidimicrobiia bacterium]
MRLRYRPSFTSVGTSGDAAGSGAVASVGVTSSVAAGGTWASGVAFAVVIGCAVASAVFVLAFFTGATFRLMTGFFV